MDGGMTTGTKPQQVYAHFMFSLCFSPKIPTVSNELSLHPDLVKRLR